jgi:hypothetical protein
MRYLLTLILVLSPVQKSLADPNFLEGPNPLLERDYREFYIGSYRLGLKELKARVRVRPSEELHCFGDYDYVLLYDHVFDAKSECAKSADKAKSDRDRICTSEKEEIRKSRDRQLSLCNTQKEAALKDAESLRLKITDLENSHSKEVQMHYIIGGGAALVITGLLTAVIKLSSNN